MFDGLFNGLFGNGEANKAADVHKQLESCYIDALRRASMSEAQQYQAMLEQVRAQQDMMNGGTQSIQSAQAYQAARNAGSGGLGGAANPWATALGDIITVTKSKYDELEHLHHWCKNTHPEVYEEWRAMQDLKEASEDEST